MIQKAHKITYFGDFVRVNPLWYDTEGEIVRDAVGLTTDDPAAWSVETGSRDHETGFLLWHVEADFDDFTVACLVACGHYAMTASTCGPGGEDSWLCYRIVSEPEYERAYADWIEWGGPVAEENQTMACRAFERQLGAPVFEDMGCAS